MKRLFLFITFLLSSTLAFSQAGDICFVHTATSGNISTNATFINHPKLNNNPSAVFFVTHNLAGDGSTTYNDKASGVFYSTGFGKWVIYNEDNTNMLVSSSYNVYIPGTGAEIVTAVAPGGQWYFVIDDPALNNKPDLHPVITHKYGGYLNNNFGVYYSGTDKWGIYCEDGSSTIPSGATFFVLAKPSEVGYNYNVSFTHTADASNQTGNNGTYLNHPLLNNNPNAPFVTTHDWGTFGVSDHVFGAYYASPHWRIYSEDYPLTYSGEIFSVVPSAPAPVNDLCTNASTLTVGTYFNEYAVTGTLLGSDGANYGGVWYSVTVPGTGFLTVETDHASGSPMHDTWMAIYSGNCGALTVIASNDNGGNGNFSKISLSGQTPGQTLYVLIEEDAGTADPSDWFRIAAYDTSLGIADVVIDGFNMYPNPVTDVLNIETSTTIDAISIYNMLGQEIINTKQTQIDMSALPSGSYIVKVQAGNQIGSYSLIKQ